MAGKSTSPIAAAAALFVSVFSAASLLIGADFVSVMLPGGLPFGNVLATAFFCGIAGAAALLAPQGTWSRPVAMTALAVSFAWLPVSIALAGNLSLNFSGQRGLVWVWFSAGLFVFALVALLLAATAAYLERRRLSRERSMGGRRVRG